MSKPERLKFFEQYFDYVTGAAESPLIYHRWAMLTCVSSLINRKVFIPFGHKNIYPNLYTILVGSAGSRKSTAITMSQDLLIAAGYRRIVKDKLHRDSLLEELAGRIDFHQYGDSQDIDSFMEIEVRNTDTADALIIGSELESVIGVRNQEMLALLTDLWDCPPGPLKLPRSSKMEPPKNIFISLLGGATISNFNRMFPSDIISQGTLSRLMLIYSSHKREKITWPRNPTAEETAGMIEWMNAISSMSGEMKVTEEARNAIDEIYRKQDNEIEDYRFEHYNERRLDHLLRLVMLCAVCDIEMEIKLNHVIYANTILKFAEKFMPTALGEFGDNDVSRVAYRILMFVRSSGRKGISHDKLLDKLKSDMANPEKIIDALHVLTKAGKIERQVSKTTRKPMYLPLQSERVTENEYVDFSLLREYGETPNLELNNMDDSLEEYENPDDALEEMKKFGASEKGNVVKFDM